MIRSCSLGLLSISKTTYTYLISLSVSSRHGMNPSHCNRLPSMHSSNPTYQAKRFITGRYFLVNCFDWDCIQHVCVTMHCLPGHPQYVSNHKCGVFQVIRSQLGRLSGWPYILVDMQIYAYNATFGRTEGTICIGLRSKVKSTQFQRRNQILCHNRNCVRDEFAEFYSQHDSITGHTIDWLIYFDALSLLLM